LREIPSLPIDLYHLLLRPSKTEHESTRGPDVRPALGIDCHHDPLPPTPPFSPSTRSDIAIATEQREPSCDLTPSPSVVGEIQAPFDLKPASLDVFRSNQHGLLVQRFENEISITVNPRQQTNNDLPKRNTTNGSTASSSRGASTCLNLPTYDIFAIDKKCYVSCEMPIPEEHVITWETGFKQRLEDALCRLSTAKHVSESSLALEFYMVGTSRKNLAPSILITCCSNRRRREIKSSLSELKWLRDSGLGLFIRVDKTFGHRTTGPLVGQPVVEGQLAADSDTLCGVAARIKASDLCGNAAVKFTFGGVICIGSDFAVLTAGHPFIPLTRAGKEAGFVSNLDATTFGSNSPDSDSDSEPESDSSTPWNSEDEAGNSLSDDDEIVTNPEAVRVSTPSQSNLSVQFVEFHHRGIVSHVDSPYLRSQIVYNPAELHGNPDWAVLLLERSCVQPFVNGFNAPGDHVRTIIDQIVPRDLVVAGPVWIIAGSGLRKGFLNPSKASVSLCGAFVDVKQITLDLKLGEWRPFSGRSVNLIAR
jgi:hypothetical protein